MSNSIAKRVNQPFIEIIEPASGNRVVTAIEVLSPDNKSTGAGMISYSRKQQELWESGANLVEIDLLSSGSRTTRVDRSRAAHEINRRYLITVTREYPTRCEFYGVDLQQSLPKIAIPLKTRDNDVTLDLQAVFQRCYNSGPYPQLLCYNLPCPSKLSDAESGLVKQMLKL